MFEYARLLRMNLALPTFEYARKRICRSYGNKKLSRPQGGWHLSAVLSRTLKPKALPARHKNPCPSSGALFGSARAVSSPHASPNV